MNGKSVVAAPLLALLSLAAGTAQAQLNPDSVVRQVSREVERSTGIELGEQRGNGNGHDKCKGNGHGGSNGGGGHEEGECEEDTGEPRGPVAETVCVAGEENAESAWQRYSCTVVAYNEDHLTGTIEANESYPEVLAEYAATEAEALQVASTEYVAAVSADIIAGDVVGAVETTQSFTFGALDRYLPNTPFPTPGPVVDEVRDYSTTTVLQLSSGDVNGAIETTQSFTFGALDRYLPNTPFPTPGPVVDEVRDYSTTTVLQLSSGDVNGAIETTQSFTFGALDRYLPNTPFPTPGPVVDEYRLPEMPSGF